MNFNGKIPEDLPDFPGGVDGTEFLPDPFFYGEETWDGLQLRLLLYLVYQRKDLAVLELRRNNTGAALAQYRKLADELRQMPVREALLNAILEVLELMIERAQVPLLLQSGRIDEARRAYSSLEWGTAPQERAWALFLRAALDWASGEKEKARASLEQALALYRPLVEAPPWQPVHGGAAPTMSARHKDRLDRVQAYSDWFNPLSTREVWGAWDPTEAWSQAWIRILATTSALSSSQTASSLLDPMLEQLRKVPELSLVGTPARLEGSGSGRDVRGAADGAPVRLEGTTSPLEVLALADGLVVPTHRAVPRTSAQLLQGMPTGDSYIDLLGQAGSPAVGTLARLSLEDEAHRAWTEGYAKQINEALAGGNADKIKPLVERMIRDLEAYSFKSRYFNIKRVRNEAVRILVLTGRYDDALEVLQGFYPLGSLDYRVPNRIGVLEAIKGRILMDAGRLEEASETLRSALENTHRWLRYVAQYRDVPTPGSQKPIRP